MRNILILVAFLASSFNAIAAQRPTGRVSAAVDTAQQQDTNLKPRAAVVRGARSATPQAGTSANSGATGAGSGLQQRRVAQTSTSTSTASGAGVRSATTPTTGNVAARAAKQSVVNTGTKVAAASQNTLVDETCRQKFDGCMDSFCMIENASGGRCLCSDRNKELKSISAEIEKLDAQSYKMATEGVEKIEMGENADVVMANAKAITKSLNKTDDAESGKSKRRTLNLDAWKNASGDEEESVFGKGDGEARIEDQEGDALFSMSYDLCVAQIPECSSNFNMLSSLYRQRVRSDCTAFENSLKKQQQESQQKLAAAEAAMREAALEQYKSANKYDLSQCAIQFKQCMKTTAGCGDDFTGCAGVAAAEEAVTKKNTKKKSKQTTIKGAVSSITIAAATYDTLMAKKPLCMDVTKNCVNVRDQVWDTFLTEVAPELKTAELLAESNLRTSCIGNIARCFQKACKDNIDPNDEDGSYDMCLSRPETLESVCKVEITPCKAAEPKIMDYVRAKLASMRVDACTKEVKECLQSEDRCGSDYSQCIGLDTDTIVRLCPQDKLTACYQEYGGKVSTVQEALTSLVDGIFLNIDNSLLTTCQDAARKKFIEICGDETSCVSVTDDPNLGLESLRSYTSGESTIIDGLVTFGKVGVNTFQTTYDKTPVDYYNVDISAYNVCPTGAGKTATLQGIFNTIKRKFDVLLADPTVNKCVTGRDMRQITGSKKRTAARFPHLLDGYSAIIADSVLSAAETNYNTKYTELFVNATNEGKAAAEDYKNTIYCNRLALMDDFDSITMGESATRSNVKPTDCQVTISGGPNSNDLLEAMKQKNTTERVLTAKISSALKEVPRRIDKRGQTEDAETMVGKETVSAAYEAGPKVCRITRTIYACSAMTTVSDAKSVDVGATVGTSGVTVGGNVGVSVSNYKGSVCNSFQEPIVTEQLINMSSGQVIEGNITRSNLTSTYVDNSSIDNSKNTSLGFGGASIGSIGNRGNIDNSSVSNVGNGSASNGGQASIGNGDTNINSNNDNNNKPRGRGGKKNQTTTDSTGGGTTSSSSSSSGSGHTNSSGMKGI